MLQPCTDLKGEAFYKHGPVSKESLVFSLWKHQSDPDPFIWLTKEAQVFESINKSYIWFRSCRWAKYLEAKCPPNQKF